METSGKSQHHDWSYGFEDSGRRALYSGRPDVQVESRMASKCLSVHSNTSAGNSFDNAATLERTISALVIPTSVELGNVAFKDSFSANSDISTPRCSQYTAASLQRSLTVLEAGCHSGGPCLVRSPMLSGEALMTPIPKPFTLSSQKRCNDLSKRV